MVAISVHVFANLIVVNLSSDHLEYSDADVNKRVCRICSPAT
jgi:hypothetical protein